MVEKLKLYKFVIIEFINEYSTEVVPKSWIRVDNNLPQFFCHWPEKANITKYASSQKNPSFLGNVMYVALENFSVRCFRLN